MLSEKIRELRRKNGLSQEELSEKLGVSRQAVSKWETGAAVPNPETLVEISDCFGVSLDFLMREQVDELSDDRVSNDPERGKVETQKKRVSQSKTRVV